MQKEQKSELPKSLKKNGHLYLYENVHDPLNVRYTRDEINEKEWKFIVKLPSFQNR